FSIGRDTPLCRGRSVRALASARSGLLAGLLAAGASASVPALAQSTLAQSGSTTTTPATPIAWNLLPRNEQEALAPLRMQWAQFSDREQQHFRRLAARWQGLPQARRDAVEQRLRHWATMTPQQRAALGSHYEKFRELPAGQQQQLRDTYHRFGSLPPEQRQALRERFEKMTPAERSAFIAGVVTEQHNQGAQRFLADTPPAERAAMRAMWFALSAPERQALRRQLRPLAASERTVLGTRLLAMTPAQRSAFIAALPPAAPHPTR
ncbi:MAG: DUF3106 domain-containing protein, partial [Dokdonella sp.]